VAVVIQNQYDELLLRINDAMEWLDSPQRSLDEVERWFPEYEKLFWQMKKLEGMMKNENVR